MMGTVNSTRISPGSWLMLPPFFQGRDMLYNFYSLAEEKVVTFNKRRGGGDGGKIVGSSHGWLILFNQSNKHLFLSNPLSSRHINLPPVPQISLRNSSVSKVIISCCPDEDEEECRAMMSFGPENGLAFCWPGHSTESTPIGTVYDEDLSGKFPRFYEDFIYSTRHKLFFSISKHGVFERWDFRDPRSALTDLVDGRHCYNGFKYKRRRRTEFHGISNLKWEFRRRIYLVFAEQSNQLFLVRRRILTRMAPNGSYVAPIYFGKHRGWDHSFPYETIGFDVYRIDDERGEGGGTKLRCMEGSMDGLAMFIGINHSSAMPAGRAEFRALKLNPNFIYFADDHKDLTPPNPVHAMYGGHDIGIFDYENRDFSSCYYPFDVQNMKRIIPPPVWFTPSPHQI